MIRSWRRRLRHSEPELNITAFLNLMVILVPFLLVTAVFSRLAIIELTLPESSTAAPPPDRLSLEITVRSDGIEVADRGGVPIVIPNRDEGYNLASLSDVLKAIKVQFPNQTDAVVLLEPDIAYEVMIEVMDAVRVGSIVHPASVVRAELFPDISIGEAPARAGS